MNTKEKNEKVFKELKYLQELSPTHIGDDKLEEPTDKIYLINNIIRVARMALEGMSNLWGSELINSRTPECNLYDISKCLGIAESLMPFEEMEILDNLNDAMSE